MTKSTLKFLNCFLLFILSYDQIFGKDEPSWFLSSDIEGYPKTDFYIGVGSGLTLNKALEQAQNMIATQIQVSIESSIETRLRSITSGDDEYFSDAHFQNIKTTTNLSLNGVEIINREKIKLKHYVLTVLNKQRFQRALKAELDELNQAMRRYQKMAESALLENNIIEVISHYSKVKEIIPHFLSKKTFYNSIALNPYMDLESKSLNAVSDEIRRVISKIKLKVLVGDKQYALVGRLLPKEVKIFAYYKSESNPIPRMPLVIKNNSHENIQEGFTNEDGIYSSRLWAISYENDEEVLLVFPNLSAFIKQFEDSPIKTSVKIRYTIIKNPPMAFNLSIQNSEGIILHKVENKVLRSLQKLGHYISEDADLNLHGSASVVDKKEIEGKNGLQYLVKSELDLNLTLNKKGSRLASFTIVGKGVSKSSYEESIEKSFKKFKIGQRDLANIIESSKGKINELLFEKSKLNFEKGNNAFKERNYLESMKFYSEVTVDQALVDKAILQIAKIQQKLNSKEKKKPNKKELSWHQSDSIDILKARERAIDIIKN